MHLLWEDMNPRELLREKTNNTHKLVTVQVDKQPTYFRLFTYANQMLERGSIAIIHNSDLYFDKTLRKLQFGRQAPGSKRRLVMGLSRRHSPFCGKKNDHGKTFDLCEHYIGSHDSFIFAPPAPKKVMENTDHFQNRYGAENIVVWAWQHAGARVLNACQRVRAFHFHCSGERHYNKQFISAGRHGHARPGVSSADEKTWMYIF